ncbi:MAG: hypothetical protein GX868_15805 [Actinobacteria bacterium]|nr:hypothetical protein [Actinomycetota bacterium]
MITRVSSSTGSKAILAGIQSSYGRLDKAQEQVITGRRINRVSDDPADAVSAVINRTVLKRFEQYGRNASEAEGWLLASDAALADASNNLAAVRTLVVQAGGATDSVARKAIADEIRAINVSLIGVANSAKSGRPIFAGTAPTAAAYDSAGNFLGNANSVTIPVLDAVQFRVNRTGPEVFGTPNPSDPINGDVFQLIDSIAASIEAVDPAAVANGLTQIDAALERISGAQVEMGTRHRQLEDVMSTIADQEVAVTTAISKKEDVDAAEAIMNYQTRLSAYEASLAVGSKILQPSLLDFLR